MAFKLMMLMIIGSGIVWHAQVAKADVSVWTCGGKCMTGKAFTFISILEKTRPKAVTKLKTHCGGNNGTVKKQVCKKIQVKRDETDCMTTCRGTCFQYNKAYPEKSDTHIYTPIFATGLKKKETFSRVFNMCLSLKKGRLLITRLQHPSNADFFTRVYPRHTKHLDTIVRNKICNEICRSPR